MSTPKSLALLVCGSLPPSLQESCGDYSVVFGNLFRDSLPRDVRFNLDPYDVVERMEYPAEDKLASYNGIVLTGSAASAYESIEWINRLVDFVAHVANDFPQIKLIGICFGHQIIGRALGGECVLNDGKWEVGPTAVELTDLGSELFGVNTLNIQQMHRDHVPAVPPTFHLLGSTSVSLNQGMVRFSSDAAPHSRSLKDIQILTLQGHPEFTKEIMNGLVDVRSKSGLLSPETVADARNRSDWHNDGVAVLGKAIWGVLGVTA